MLFDVWGLPGFKLLNIDDSVLIIHYKVLKESGEDVFLGNVYLNRFKFSFGGTITSYYEVLDCLIEIKLHIDKVLSLSQFWKLHVKVSTFVHIRLYKFL